MKILLLIVCVLVLSPSAVLAEAHELQVDVACAPPIAGREAASVDACLKLAQTGSARATYYMGIHYEQVDWKLAEAWHLRAREMGFQPASKRIEYVRGARSQGRVDNFLAGGAVLILSVALVVVCRRQADRRVCRHSCLLLAPWYAVIALWLLWESGGAWGALKHPLLHAADPGPATFCVLAVLALLALPGHIYLLKAGVLRRSYVVTSLVLFGVVAAAAVVLLMFLAELASQGAGR
jgi:hypothetical protein